MPNPINSLADKLEHLRAAHRARLERDAYLSSLVEQMVDGIDPRLRIVGGYARKLRPAVMRMLTYADEACGRLPGPVECSRHGWSTNPTVKALFATPDDLREVFSNNRSIHEFFQRPESQKADEAYAILGMKKEQKIVLGMDREGDMIRRDVRQINVNFGDYRITHPANDEDTLRRNLRQRALNEFLGQAMIRITQIKQHRQGLRERRLMLELRLKSLQRAEDGLTALLEGEDQVRRELTEVRRELESLEQQCTEVRASIGTLSVLLDLTVSLLNEPQDLIAISPLTLCLDPMNRLVEVPLPNTGVNPVILAQVTFCSRLTRYGILTRFPRSEFSPRTPLWRQGLH